MLPDKFTVDISLNQTSATYLGIVLGLCVGIGIIIGSIVARRL